MSVFICWSCCKLEVDLSVEERSHLANFGKTGYTGLLGVLNVSIYLLDVSLQRNVVCL